MAQNTLKQGKVDNSGAILLFIVVPCMWGLRCRNDSPAYPEKLRDSDVFSSDEAKNPAISATECAAKAGSLVHSMSLFLLYFCVFGCLSSEHLACG